MKQNLLKDKSSRQNDQSRIKEDRDRVLAQVKDSRQKINAHLDKLEASVTKEAHRRYQKYFENIQKDLAQCDVAIKKIEETIKEIEDPSKPNEQQLFVNVKQGSENVNRWRLLGHQIKSQVGEEEIEFYLDDKLEKCVTSLQKLGTFVKELERPRRSHTVIGQEKPESEDEERRKAMWHTWIMLSVRRWSAIGWLQ